MGLEDLDLGNEFRYVKDVSKDETVDVTTCGGVTKKCIKVGGASGRPGDGAKVTVHATGRLDDGTVFEDSRAGDGAPVCCRLGQGRMTAGFDLGIKTMRKGEKAVFTIKPKYGYGKKGDEGKGIPPNAVLIWDVELLDYTLCEDVSEQRLGGVLKEVIDRGDGEKKPCYESRAVADVRLEIEDSPDADAAPGALILAKEKWEFTIGEEEQLPEGVDDGLSSMHAGEQAVLHILPSHAWGTKGCEELKVPPNARVRATLHLHSFDVPKDCWSNNADGKESWDLTYDECIAGADQRKAQANEYYKAKKLRFAKKKYESAIRVLQSGRCNELIRDAILTKKMKRAEGEEVGWALRSPGLVVTKVVDGSPAQKAGVQVGWMLREIDEKDMNTEEDVGERLKISGTAEFEVCFNEERHPERKQRVRELLLQLFNNATAVNLAMQEWNAAVSSATKAVYQDKACAKAYLRRAKAQAALCEWDAARRDLDKVLQELEPGNADAQKELDGLRRRMKQHKEKQKAAYGKMFGGAAG